MKTIAITAIANTKWGTAIILMFIRWSVCFVMHRNRFISNIDFRVSTWHTRQCNYVD
ncbi:MAG: hypothetical protein ABIQ27_10565 [Flavobacterium sp.]|uniref:hypothetical protein n=1 Tax=Flavobacterium sp. TaxID=239 RepID=UPI003265B192